MGVLSKQSIGSAEGLLNSTNGILQSLRVAEKEFPCDRCEVTRVEAVDGLRMACGDRGGRRVLPFEMYC